MNNDRGLCKNKETSNAKNIGSCWYVNNIHSYAMN